jgi:ribosomal protein S18 acetylase RimI-like enzyme
MTLAIVPLTLDNREEATNVILEGLKERFGKIDPIYNPDLDNIYETFSQPNHYFYTGILHEKIIATGAFYLENNQWRIVRMSVLKKYRNQGIGKQMLQFLEMEIKAKKGKEIILETTKTWSDAIQFYERNGYNRLREIHQDIHFLKTL